MDDSLREFLTDTSESLLALVNQQDIRVDIFRSNDSPSTDYFESIDPENAAVRVTQHSSGRVAQCAKYSTRIQNQIAALIELTTPIENET